MTRKREDLTQAELKANLHYDPDTGIFTRLKSNTSRVKVGDIAGTKTYDHYIMIGLCNFRYFAHRLAWLYEHGSFPLNFIDHIDGNRSNNKIKNLRNATNSENMQNLIRANSNNKSGLLGVTSRKNNFEANLKVNGIKLYLGVFKTSELAHEAYLEAKRRLHPTCTI